MIINAPDHENQLLNAALAYAKKGWRVLPLHSFADGACTCEKPDCTSPAKHPLTARGVHDATTDEATIRRWWSEAPSANVGIATGGGLLVLDVDAKNGGLESLADLERQHGALPTTPTVNTGGGGRHYYFSTPAGTKLTNKAGIAAGLDIRAENGYVVAPPSLHASGKLYQWSTPSEASQDTIPPWLLGMIENRPATTPTKAEGKGMMLTVRAEVEDLSTHPGVGEGQRNAVLCKLIGVHLARGEDPRSSNDSP